MSSEVEFVSSGTLHLAETGQASLVAESCNPGDELECGSRVPDWVMDQAAFDELLCWLDLDPETAGQKYELIRRKLITLFACRRCISPEDLADETFNRVARILPRIKPYYSGSPSAYFYGVAKKIYMEYLRSTAAQHVSPPPPVKEDMGQLLQHLNYALNKLTRADRELILSYYWGERRSKINNRKALARQMGLPLNVLRLRVYRIRFQLRNYLKAEM